MRARARPAAGPGEGNYQRYKGVGYVTQIGRHVRARDAGIPQIGRSFDDLAAR
jgi:hypothetical protein